MVLTGAVSKNSFRLGSCNLSPQCVQNPQWVVIKTGQQQIEGDNHQADAASKASSATVRREHQNATETAAGDRDDSANRADDLLQQTRMAQASERTLTAVRCQNRLIAFDGVLIALTVIAAFLAVWDARQHSERGLRAYVFPETKEITNWKTHDLAKEVTFTFKNFGQTPAYDVRASLIFERADYSDNTQEPKLIEPVLRETGSRDSIGPGDSREREWSLKPLSVADLSAVEAGQLAWFLHGLIAYRDAFGKPRWTKFRYYVGGPMKFKRAKFTATPTGNETEGYSARQRARDHVRPLAGEGANDGE